mgnify:CR=1 FL=1
MNYQKLSEHIGRYYKKSGCVVHIKPCPNLLGEDKFAEVTFENGKVRSFCCRDDGSWYRNERAAKTRVRVP